MKRTIYIHKQAYIYLSVDAINGFKNGLYKFRINGIESIGRLTLRNKKTKEGITTSGSFAISKNTADYLNLKHMDEIDFEILDVQTS
jgi:hypothetical protein